VQSLNKTEKAVILLTLIAIIGCYNVHTFFDYVDYSVGFPFFKGHSEPISWYIKDVGGRVSIFLLSGLMYYLIQDRLNWKYTMLFRATVGFLAKDVIDYIISYDQFTPLWDTVFYISIIIYVLFNKQEWCIFRRMNNEQV
jgi:hypothetical protein